MCQSWFEVNITENFDLAGGFKNNYKSLDEKKLSENLRLRVVKLVDKLSNMCQGKRAINVY